MVLPYWCRAVATADSAHSVWDLGDFNKLIDKVVLVNKPCVGNITPLMLASKVGLHNNNGLSFKTLLRYSESLRPPVMTITR